MSAASIVEGIQFLDHSSNPLLSTKQDDVIENCPAVHEVLLHDDNAGYTI